MAAFRPSSYESSRSLEAKHVLYHLPFLIIGVYKSLSFYPLFNEAFFFYYLAHYLLFHPNSCHNPQRQSIQLPCLRQYFHIYSTSTPTAKLTAWFLLSLGTNSFHNFKHPIFWPKHPTSYLSNNLVTYVHHNHYITRSWVHNLTTLPNLQTALSLASSPASPDPVLI